jgi:hypothetical protein
MSSPQVKPQAPLVSHSPPVPRDLSSILSITLNTFATTISLTPPPTRSSPPLAARILPPTPQSWTQAAPPPSPSPLSPPPSYPPQISSPPPPKSRVTHASALCQAAAARGTGRAQNIRGLGFCICLHTSDSRNCSLDPYADLQEKMRRKEELLREREDKVTAGSFLLRVQGFEIISIHIPS